MNSENRFIAIIMFHNFLLDAILVVDSAFKLIPVLVFAMVMILLTAFFMFYFVTRCKRSCDNRYQHNKEMHGMTHIVNHVEVVGGGY